MINKGENQNLMTMANNNFFFKFKNPKYLYTFLIYPFCL